MDHELRLTQTLSAVEIDPGDTLQIHMLDGTRRTLQLEDAFARVVKRGKLPYADKEGIILYRVNCKFTLDGHRVHLVRNIPSQLNFTDPPCFMGLHIWLDATSDVADFLGQHGPTAECFPTKRCRLAIWDASARICPHLLHPFCPLPEGALRVEQCYRGEDTWMGPYDGTECHGGLDINHPAGTPLWTPIAIHEHELFGQVGVDDANNNRWRGLHHWPDGKTWVLQAHHMIRLLVPEDQPLDAGVHFAEAAGVLSGAHEHTHFVFGVIEDGQRVLIDPWLLFWQTYRDQAVTRQPF